MGLSLNTLLLTFAFVCGTSTELYQDCKQCCAEETKEAAIESFSRAKLEVCEYRLAYYRNVKTFIDKVCCEKETGMTLLVVFSWLTSLFSACPTCKPAAAAK